MTSIKSLEEQVAQQAALAEQAEQAAQQAREAKARAEQELLDAMVQAEAAAKAQSAEEEAEAFYASVRGKVGKKAKPPLKMPHVEEKIMPRSYQRSKTVASGTQLGSGSKQATVTFKPAMFKVLEIAAAENEVSLSEIVRQLVDKGLRA